MEPGQAALVVPITTILPGSGRALCLHSLGKATLIIFLPHDLKNGATGNIGKHFQNQGTSAQNHDAVGLPVWYHPAVSFHPLVIHLDSKEEQGSMADCSDLGSDLPLDPSLEDTLEDIDPVSPDEELKPYSGQVIQIAKLLGIVVTSSNPRP